MQNILVPLDGTPLAEAALPFATAIAARAGASLTLVRAAVYRPLSGDVAAKQVRVITTGEDYLAQTAMRLRAKGVRVHTRVPLGGSPAKWIVEESQSYDVDLVVMATHHREGIDRWLHGSVAEDVVHSTNVPVMLVRGTADARLAQRFQTHEPALVVPLDGSEFADAALPVASELAGATGARIVLVGVVPRPGQFVAGEGGAIATYAGAEHAALEADARSYLEAQAGRLRDLMGSESVIRYGAAVEEISAAADEYAAASVVMATHGRTGPVRSMFGSVAGGVLHGTSVPVVLVRPTQPRPTAQTDSPDAVAGPAH